MLGSGLIAKIRPRMNRLQNLKRQAGGYRGRAEQTEATVEQAAKPNKTKSKRHYKFLGNLKKKR